MDEYGSPDFERFRRAVLNQGEGDRVPLSEIGIDPVVKRAFLGRRLRGLKDEVVFWADAGYDYVPLDQGLHSLLEESSTVRVSSPRHVLKDPNHPCFEHLGIIHISLEEPVKFYDVEQGYARHWAQQHTGAITNWEQFERFPWPTADDFNYDRFEEVKQYLPPGMRVVGVLGFIFTAVWHLMGFEGFASAMLENPSLVEAMCEKVGDLQLGVLERMVEFDTVGAVWHPDDIAYTEALMVSPGFLRQHVFPWLRKCGQVCHKKGLPWLYHSDGNLQQVMEDLIDVCGFDALHPIEPKAMDIVHLKHKYGDRLALIGNIDLGYTLTRGTPEEVEEEVKERLREVAPGGGYCIGSSNSIPGYVPFENYMALRKASLKYGRYPISI